jgi:hypothetical protein
MPDPMMIATVAGLAFLVCILIGLTGIRVGNQRVWTILAMIAVCSGLYSGRALLHHFGVVSALKWPPQEDQQRLLILLLPATIVIELFTAYLQRPWITFLFRLVISALALPTLLYGTVYLSGTTSGWTPTQTGIYFSLSGILLLSVWMLIARISTTPEYMLPCLALFTISTISGLAAMLSGYLSGGLLGVPLSGSILGLILFRWLTKAPHSIAPLVGPMVITIFGILAGGHFMGEIPLPHTLIIFCSLLLTGLSLVPLLRACSPWLKLTLISMLILFPAGFSLGHIVYSSIQIEADNPYNAY